MSHLPIQVRRDAQDAPLHKAVRYHAKYGQRLTQRDMHFKPCSAGLVPRAVVHLAEQLNIVQQPVDLLWEKVWCLVASKRTLVLLVRRHLLCHVRAHVHHLVVLPHTVQLAMKSCKVHQLTDLVKVEVIP